MSQIDDSIPLNDYGMSSQIEETCYLEILAFLTAMFQQVCSPLKCLFRVEELVLF